MATLVKNEFMSGPYNNYLIAGNVVNAFCLGEIGSEEDFFLIGAEPQEESSYPLLTGNVLDSDGAVLFRLVRNVITFNPGHCSLIRGNHLGYEIHDSAGNMVFRVRTAFELLPGRTVECFVTTLAGNFFDRNGRLVFSANSGEANERIEANVKSVFGFSGGGFGLVIGLSDRDIEVAQAMLVTGGAVNEIISGDLVGQELTLDGKALIDARLKDCKIRVTRGNFLIAGTTSMERCEFGFDGEAATIRDLVMGIEKS